VTHAQIAHECGHATVAKQLGYGASVSNFDELPKTHFDPPIWEMRHGLDLNAPAGPGVSRMPRKHRLLIWAAGRAAMELMGAENPCDGFADDRSNMVALGCSEEEIGSRVQKAKAIIRANHSRWLAMRHLLHQRDGLGEQQGLSRDEIDEIWRQVDPG